jgi:phage tail-like protein
MRARNIDTLADMPPPIMLGHALKSPRFGVSCCVVSSRGLTVGTFSSASGTVVGGQSLSLQSGSIGNGDFYTWVKSARFGHVERRRVAITEFAATGQRLRSYTLRNAWPIRWTGPTLTAKGGGDVAIEELVLAHEGVEPE